MGEFGTSFNSGVEQMAARKVHYLEAAGSSPAPATKFRRMLAGIRNFFLMALIVILPERR